MHSKISISCSWKGYHMLVQYSSFGRTSAQYTKDRVLHGQYLRLRDIKCNMVLAFFGNQVGLLVPVEILTDGNSDVLCLRDGAQNCHAHLIKLVQSVAPGYVNDALLSGVEGHDPAHGPVEGHDPAEGPVEERFGRSHSGFAGTRGSHLRRSGCWYLWRLVMAYHWYRSGKAVVWGPFLVELQREWASGSELSPSTTTLILRPVRKPWIQLFVQPWMP